ncbi:FO synthase subunit domain containing protein [Pandoravirus celtis]|uniref:FO synthase subunit domain containing protein n=1 Tax=Pandoravirus celtis TaxID=2568002 RepID=A0A4D6EI81_9VIRU|nr:FO synthase subunit domain containing protein [Pandoravirus celtis]
MHSNKYKAGAAVKVMAASWRDSTMARIADAVLANRPLGFADGVYLYRRAALDDVRTLAAYRKQTRHGDHVHYARSLRITVGHNRNRTPLLRRVQPPVASRTIDIDEMATPADMERLLRSYVGVGLAGVTVSTHAAAQGSLVPPATVSVDWWCALFKAIRHTLPHVRIKACAPTDIVNMADCHGITLDATLSRLSGAGLGLLAGGGINGVSAAKDNGGNYDDLDGVKHALCEWIAVHRRAYDLGLDSDAILDYDCTPACKQRVLHLLAIRDFQQEALASGRPAFGRLSLVRRRVRSYRARGASWDDDLRNYAVARLMAHNVEHIAVDPALDMDRAVCAIGYGADDLGGYASAGAVDALVRRLYDIGAVPVQHGRTDGPSKQHQHPHDPLADTMWPIVPS